MKTETKTNKSVRLLSILTLLVILISGLGITRVVNAAANPDASGVKLNTTDYLGKSYYTFGDVIQLGGKIRSVASGSVWITVEIKKASGGDPIIKAEDEISYVNGPNVLVSDFVTLNAILGNKKPLSAGDYLCHISVGVKPVGRKYYENFDFENRYFTVVSKSTKEYRFVSRLAEQFVMSKGWTCFKTLMLEAKNKNNKAMVIAKEAVDSYLTRYPNCSPETFVTRLYRGILGREPDAEGFNYWVSSIKAGRPKTEVAKWWTSVQNVEFIEYLNDQRLYNH